MPAQLNAFVTSLDLFLKQARTVRPPTFARRKHARDRRLGNYNALLMLAEEPAAESTLEMYPVE